MILVLGGTKDARIVVEMLATRGHQVLASAATAYGGELLAGAGATRVSDRPLGRQELADLMDDHKIRTVVDATHPYAVAISAMATDLCGEKGIPYHRYHRPETILPEHPLVTFACSYEEAAERAAEIGEVIFLTTGSKTLDTFIKAARVLERRVVARVLPDPQVLARCLTLGLTPADIVAAQGPFSRDLNRALFQHYGARVVVTKDSGPAGGTAEKIEAALGLDIPVVVVGRPEPVKGCWTDLEELIRVLE